MGKGVDASLPMEKALNFLDEFFFNCELPI
jgi:hypothetical protein